MEVFGLEFENVQAPFCCSTKPPPGSLKTKSGISAPHLARIDVGVMPLIRPDEKSDGVSLSDKLRGRELLRRFISENSAINSRLSAIVNEASPNEKSVGATGTQYDLVARSSEQFSLSPVCVSVRAVMPLKECKARFIAVLRQVPVGHENSTRTGATATMKVGNPVFAETSLGKLS